ncbi:hypothetical protein EJ04DRAFT_338584 [Polyplosphaeria fusca]|uniref:Uncharacterized protein n=1 Tax=Polyplosphaeria fusca TaxID=682080 RepID=A0A9P4UZF1_9PLEO|nr:hypothetical protein EJ04DRAFT_338584 [Polyplosphaeria fusca]
MKGFVIALALLVGAISATPVATSTGPKPTPPRLPPIPANDARYKCSSHSDCGNVSAYNCCGVSGVCARTDAAFVFEDFCGPNSPGGSVCSIHRPVKCGCNEDGLCGEYVLE